MSPKKSRVELLRQYFQLGIGILGSIAFSVLKFPELLAIVDVDPVKGIMSIILFAVTLAYIGGWIYFDYMEIQFVDDYIDTARVKLKSETFLSAVVIGSSAGFLIGFVDLPRFFLLVLLVLLIMSIVGNKIVRQKISQHYLNDDDYQTGARKYMLDYYMKSQFNILDISAIVFCLAGLGLAWYANITTSRIEGLIAQGLAILIIFVHECIIWIWRIRRNQKIEEYEDQLDEIK